MLYDPKWQKQPRTIEHLIEWLESHQPDRRYRYMDSYRCLAQQYNDHVGHDYKIPNPIKMWWGKSFDAKLEKIGSGRPHTFGGALERARKYLT